MEHSILIDGGKLADNQADRANLSGSRQWIKSFARSRRPSELRIDFCWARDRLIGVSGMVIIAGVVLCPN